MARGILTDEQRERCNEANKNQDRSNHPWSTEAFRFEKPDEDLDVQYYNESEVYFRNTMHGSMDDINDFELILRGTG